MEPFTKSKKCLNNPSLAISIAESSHAPSPNPHKNFPNRDNASGKSFDNEKFKFFKHGNHDSAWNLGGVPSRMIPLSAQRCFPLKVTGWRKRGGNEPGRKQSIRTNRTIRSSDLCGTSRVQTRPGCNSKGGRRDGIQGNWLKESPVIKGSSDHR